jgi:hypothetical protein
VRDLFALNAASLVFAYLITDVQVTFLQYISPGGVRISSIACSCVHATCALIQCMSHASLLINNVRYLRGRKGLARSVLQAASPSVLCVAKFDQAVRRGAAPYIIAIWLAIEIKGGSDASILTPMCVHVGL